MKFIILSILSISLSFSFPKKINVEKKSLVLNGTAIREATFFKIDVYEAAFYLPQKSSDLSVVNNLFPKRITIKYLRDIPFEKLEESLVKSLKKYNLYSKENALILKKWKPIVGKISKGLEMSVEITESSVTLIKGRKKSTFVKPALAKKFHLLWVGEASGTSFRAGLLDSGQTY